MTDTAKFLTTESEAPAEPGTVADPATAAIERPGSLPTPAQSAAAAKDRTLTSPAAVEMAHAALTEITDPLSVGAHAGARSEAERVVTHLFECNLAGYRGWRWAVTLTRPPRSRTATVCEMELLPGEDALLAPAWVPWADRLQPGDVTRSDRLPKRETDERLEPGWEATGENEGDTVGSDALLAAGTDALDFGRARVLSPEGVQRAAQRWYDGDHGPEAEGVRKAHATCSTCGFFVPLAGPLRNVFGICANEWAEDDGRVVSLDHGCGAHSETDLPDQGPDWPVTPSRLDERALEPLGTDGSSIREGRSQEELVAEAAAERSSEPGADDAASDGPDASEDGAAGSAGRRRSRRAGSARGAAAESADADAADDGDGAPAADERDGAGDESVPPADGTATASDGTGTEEAGTARERSEEPAEEAPAPKRARRSSGKAAAPSAAEETPAKAGRSRRGSRSARKDEDFEERPSRGGRSSRSSRSAAHAPVKHEAGPEGAEERAESARHAVADLAAELGVQTESHEHHAPTTLAELEAALPSRD